MASVLCVECKLPICVSSDPNNKVACFDPCGHFVHARCGKILFGMPHEANNNNNSVDLPRPTKQAKCGHCKSAATNMFIVFAGGNITGQFEAQDGGDQVDQNPHLRITAEMKAELKKAEDEAIGVREIAGQIAEKTKILATKEHDLARERDAVAQLQNAMTIKESDLLKNKPLHEVRRKAREIAAEVEAHHAANKHKKNKYTNTLDMQNAIMENMNKAREMEREVMATTFKISTQRGELKAMKKDERKLQEQLQALQRLLGQGGSNLNPVSFENEEMGNSNNDVPDDNNNNNQVKDDDGGDAAVGTKNDEDDFDEAMLYLDPPQRNNNVDKKNTKKSTTAKNNNKGIICIDLDDDDGSESDDEVKISQPSGNLSQNQINGSSCNMMMMMPASILPANNNRFRQRSNNNNNSGPSIPMMPRGETLPISNNNRVQLQLALERSM